MVVSLVALWLPILLSAVFVFVASSILHMMLRWHRKDFAKLPHEEDVLAALRKAGAGPGDYIFPCPESPAAMRSPEMLDKFKRGPVGFLTLVPSGAPGMGKNLVMWFLYSIVMGIFAAYLTGRTLAPGAEYRAVFRIAGTVAFVGYAGALWPASIWRGVSWGTTIRSTCDGLVYGLLTGGVFGWLWPR